MHNRFVMDHDLTVTIPRYLTEGDVAPLNQQSPYWRGLYPWLVVTAGTRVCRASAAHATPWRRSEYPRIDAPDGPRQRPCRIDHQYVTRERDRVAVAALSKRDRRGGARGGTLTGRNEAEDSV